MRAIIVSVMQAVLVPLGGCFHHTQAVAVTPLTTPSLKWSRISHGSHSATAFSHCSHLRAGFRWQRVASANTIGFCQKGKLVSNGCRNNSDGADSGVRPTLPS